MERELIGVDPTDLEKVYWIMDRTAAHSGSAKNAIDMVVKAMSKGWIELE